jgi:hypothetical protein
MMDLAKLAFLETFTLENNAGIMGAILVTDADTKPLEFRVTAPIKTTNFQKTLYGDVLMEHILVELISIPLISAINEEIDLVLVRDPLFLGANNKQGTRIVRIFNGEAERSRNSKNGEALNSIGANGSKVFVETTKKYETELPEIQKKLSLILDSRNLIEPFERLKIACEQVHLQKTGE